MKTTEKATDKILVKAYTDSEWDKCNFAIIKIDNQWKDAMLKREENTNTISASDKSFAYTRYYDTSISFYHKDDEWLNDILGSACWSYVELDDDEEKELSIPENRLIAYCVSMFSNGVLMYTAFGKHTNEEFFTEEVCLSDLIK